MPPSVAVPIFNLTGDEIIVQGSNRDFVLRHGIDLTGYDVRAQLRADFADISAAIIATFTCTVLPGTLGDVLYQLTNAQTAAIAILGGKWDSEAYINTTYVQRLVMGSWELSREVTR